MKTNKRSKVFQAASVGAAAVAVVLLCVVLLQVMQGGLSTFEAEKVTYFSQDAAAVAKVRNCNVIHVLGMIGSSAKIRVT
ncbi:MAG: hypothetical protein LBJ11_06315 [Oscillospiraceae bacterium]|jgi:hypothetical protein|nr:hypothetical protein [Oscillospiraceae bacterium]